MARTSRVELNRRAFAELELAHVDALMAVAGEVLAVVRPPDAPPYGAGLVQGGGAVGYIGRKKVADTRIGGRAIKKPRSLRLRDDEVTAAVGFGFPARFVELGTLHTPAQPFLSRAVARIVPDAEVIISAAVRKRLARAGRT